MRARNIKPALFSNELLGTADPLFTILFAGLWCEADREGRLEDRPIRIRANVFPYRPEVKIDTALDWLHKNGFIHRYAVGEVKVIQVLAFAEHQRPHTNEAPSKLPKLSAKVQSTANHGEQRVSPKRAGLRSDSLIPDLLITDSQSLIDEAGLPPINGHVVGLNISAYQEWIEYRQRRKKPLPKESLPKTMRKLLSFGDHASQQAAVDNSIANGYQGLFEPKQSNQSKPARAPKSVAELEAEEAARNAKH